MIRDRSGVAPTVLTIPGLWNSGPQHWQTHWEAKHGWQRVVQRDMDLADRDEWVETLDRAVAAQPSPVILAAHSLGCSLVAQWAKDRGGRGVAGAFLVAPSDVEAPGYPAEGRSFSSMPLATLPFPTVVVASANDEYVALDRARAFAAAWGSDFVVIGDAGHINGASGHGPWPEGERLLLEFLARLSHIPSGRPLDGEFAPYAKSDIDFVTGDDAVDVLRRQRDETIALFDSIGERAGLTYAPGKWTIKEVLGHLADDERIFAYRALCVARGDETPLPGFDEKLYVANAGFESRPMRDLIDEYRIVRDYSIAFFETLSSDAWLRRGNVNGYVASTRGLAFHIAAHELHHLRIVKERYLR